MDGIEEIDEILDRLEHGEVLKIDDQWRSYISIEGCDGPDRFVVRSVPDSEEDEVARGGELHLVKYKETRPMSLAEALLSVMDWEWYHA
jgi:hypothetical protein